jgi:hypothetical protein
MWGKGMNSLTRLWCAIFAFLILGTPLPVLADGPRGTFNSPECPRGSVLAGFSGQVGLWIDKIGPICAQANSDRTFRQPISMQLEFGGNGGKHDDVYCPIGTVLSGIEIAYARDDQVASLALTCRLASNGQPTGVLYFGNKDYRASAPPPGAKFMRAKERRDCPIGQMPIGFTVHHGAYVYDVRPTCAQFAYPAAPSKVSKAKPSGPPVVIPSAMRGAWNTRTNQDGYFTVILVPGHDGLGALANQPIPVTGQFINQQGAHDYDGTLQGVIRPYSRTLEYSYVQKNGAAGTGTFTLSNDGNSITGSGKGSDGTSFTWNGTRAK